MNEKKGLNNTIMFTIIIILLLIIIAQVYYMNSQKTVINSSVDLEVNEKINSEKNAKDITITIITDERCGINCDTSPIITQLKQIPVLTNINIIELDYSDKKAKQILKENNITKLPTVLFNTKEIPEISKYLKEVNNNLYSLEIWATFDPTKKRSEKWFLILEKSILENIKKDTFVKWDKNSKISWIEYSDLDCPYCVKLHNSGTTGELKEKYSNNLNKIFQNFPLDFHKNALPAANLLECAADQKGSEIYYKLIDYSFKNENSNLSFLTKESVRLGADKEKLQKCIDEKTFYSKILEKQKKANEYFGITWTPWNVLINNETWEYKIISWAYPTSSFKEIIDKLLK